MDRRTFLVTASGLVAAPFAAQAQQASKVSRIGVLGTSPPAAAVSFQAFRKGLEELGYVEGQQVLLDYRWPEGERQGYSALAAQLVQGRFDVILTISAGAARAAKQATNTVPIVFCSMGDDPVQLGMVASLARPGGNATGTVILSRELEAKRLELLKEAVPGLSRAAVLWNSRIPLNPRVLQEVEEAARLLNIRVIPVEWKVPGDLEKAFQLASVAYSLTVFVTVSATFARMPAFAESLPSVPETALAAAVTVLAGLAGGVLASGAVEQLEGVLAGD